jgi:hypothetical protein
MLFLYMYLFPGLKSKRYITVISIVKEVFFWRTVITLYFPFFTSSLSEFLLFLRNCSALHGRRVARPVGNYHNHRAIYHNEACLCWILHLRIFSLLGAKDTYRRVT